MKDRFGSAASAVPDELRSLDVELSSIRYEERPSFGPELEAELSREWHRLKSRRRTSVRPLAAAAVVALLVATAGVPSARASLVRLIGAFQIDETDAADVVAEVRPTEPEETPVVTVSPIVEQTEEASERGTVPMDPPGEPGTIDRTGWPAPTLPEVADRARVEAMVRRGYPLALQRAGIGGSVALLLWVDSAGSVDFVNLVEGSGVPELDRAALQVAPSILFVPAARRGRAVGTWVQFPIVFRANPDAIDPLALPVVEAFDGPEVDEPLAPIAEVMAGTIVHLLASDLESGPVNLTAPAPVTNREFTKTLGKALGRPTISPLPAFMVKLLFGEMGETLLLGGARIQPEVLLKSGFKFQFPALEDSLVSLMGRVAP